MLKAGLNYDWIDSTGRNFISFSLFQGLEGASARMENNDPKSSRPGADNRFTKGFLNLARVQRIVDRVSILLRGSGQASTRPLTATEEILHRRRSTGSEDIRPASFSGTMATVSVPS